MEYRKLGSSGVLVSSVSLGTMNVSSDKSKSNHLSLFESAINDGVNYIDTADNYCDGEAENFVGELISKLDRNRLLLSTKCFFPKDDTKITRGLTRKNLLNTVETSLKKFGTDYIDILYCHRFDKTTPLEETISAMHDLIQSGKVLYWGISSYSTFQLCNTFYTARLMGVPTPIVTQHAYNIFNRTIEMEHHEALLGTGMGVVAYYTLAQGILTGKYTNGIPSGSRASFSMNKNTMWDFSEQNLRKATSFAHLCSEIGLSPSVLAIKWVLRNSNVSTALTNINSQSQWRDLTKTFDKELPQDIWGRIDEIFLNIPVNQYTGLRYQS